MFVREAALAAIPTTPIAPVPPIMQHMHDMLAEAVLENTSIYQRRNALDWVVSFGLHFAILGVLLILPLLVTNRLEFQKLNLTFLATPPMPAAPPPPPLSPLPRPAHVSPPRILTAALLLAPSFIPKAIMNTPESADAPLVEASVGVPGGIPGGQVGGVIGGVLGGAMKSVPVPVATGPRAPVRVGGEVKPPRLLYAPEPEYPALAMQSRLSGSVIIEAIIDEHGNVKGMQVVSGHPLLIPAALSAVSKRRYEPTVLDGEPTPIDLRVEIRFSFS